MTLNSMILIAIALVIIVAMVCYTCIINRKLEHTENEVRESHRHIEELSKISCVNTAKINVMKSDMTRTNSSKEAVKVFIAHSVKQKSASKKWEELKKAFEKLTNYEVFLDADSLGENDISYCRDNLNLSDIIIILIGDQYAFINADTGVFVDELEHISRGVSEGGLVYVCCYGPPNPLDIAIKECENDNNKIYLSKLKNIVKSHSYNIKNMHELACIIDQEWRKLLCNGNKSKNIY